MSDLERLATWLVDNQDKKGTPEFGVVEAGFRELYSPPAPAYTPPPVDPTQPLPDADSGFFRQALDIPTQVAKGAVTGTRFLTDVFGADNPVSQKLSGVEDVLDDLLSAQAKRDQQEVARIMQQAEDKGVGEQIKAGLQAMTVAPVDLISNAFGTSVPTLVAGLAASTPAAALGIGTGVGVLTGVGITKDAAYDAVLQELTNAGVPEEQAKEAAQEAQAYSGENLDNIAFGGFLGGLAARFGLEKTVFTGAIGRSLGLKVPEEAVEEAAKRGIISEASRAAITEAIPEALQGGQEQFTRNVALQREGFDVPTGRGVATAATLEGAVGAPVGAIAAGAQQIRLERGEAEALKFINDLATGLEDSVSNLTETAPEEPVSVVDPATLTEEQIKEAVSVAEDIEEQKFLTSLNTLTPEERTSELAAQNITPEQLNERVQRVTKARDILNSLGVAEARAQDAVNNLQRKEIKETFESEEAYNAALDDANKYLNETRAKLFNVTEAGYIDTKVSKDPKETKKLIKEAELEQLQEAYTQAERQLEPLNEPAQSTVDELTSKDLRKQATAEEPFTPEEAAKTYFTAEGLTSSQIALREIAYDVATNDATIQEISQRRERQPNIPADEFINDAAKRIDVAKPPLARAAALQAEQWVRSNLDPAAIAQFEQLVKNFKREYQNDVIREARAKRLAGRKGTQRIKGAAPSVEAEARRIATEPSPVEQAERQTDEATTSIEEQVEEAAAQATGPLAQAIAQEINARTQQGATEAPRVTSEQLEQQRIEQGFPLPETKTKYKGENIDPEVVAIAETGNLNRTITALLDTLPKELRSIVRVMRTMATATTIEIAPVEGPFPGKYDSGTNTITLDPERGLNTGVFFHELAHAALARRLNDPNSDEAKKFFDFFSQIKDQMGDAYGGTDLDEFVSELVSNSEFQNLLKEIKAPKSDSFWKNILDAILEFFGKKKGQSAYEAGIEFIGGILDIDPSVEPPPLSKVFYANANPNTAIKSVINKLNPFSATNARRVINSITGTGAPTLKTQAMGFLRLDNLFDMYGDYLKSLGVLIDETELRQGQQEQAIEEVNKKYNAMLVVLNKFKPQMRAMSKMAIDMRIARVDILKAKPKDAKKAAAWEEGTAIFTGLPKEVQNVYRIMRNDFDKMYEEYVNKVLKNITNEKLREEVAEKFKEDPPIAGYVPFRRYGQFVLVYVDKDTKQRTVKAFESAEERDMEIQELGLTQRPDIQEAVEDADTDEAEEEVRQRKLGTGEYITVNSIREAAAKTLPPEGFVAELMEKIRQDGAEQNVSKKQLDRQVEVIYGAYLDLFPESSISKSFKKAKDVPGASEDLVRAYGDTMVKWARKMADIDHNGKIEKAFRDVKKEAESYRQKKPSDPSPENIMAAGQSILDREDFTLNPTFSPLSRWATTGSYSMFMAGNISSGVVNLSSIPLLTFPILAGKFGGIKASAALTKAGKVAVIDIMKTEGVPKWGTADYEGGRYVELYNTLKDHGQLRHTLAREVLEGTRETTEEYTGTFSKFLNLLSLPIERTERYNRTTTAIMAFDLALADGMTEEKAADYALRTVKDVNTSGMASTAPKWMQTDVGRVMFTFKSFIWQSSYVTAKAFVDSIKRAPDRTRIEAFRQLAFTFGMSYSVAGLFGLPFFGAISVLTNMINSLLDDDEEPFNLRRELMMILPEAVTKGPTNYYTNLEISNRASVANGILFREDPYEIEKYGYLQSMALQAFGPLGSYAMDAPYGMRLIAEGDVGRGVERLSPSWLRNGIKTMRFAREGARTIDGRPIDTDLSTYNLYMQSLGFTPASMSSLYETRALAKQYESQTMRARSKLLKQRYLAMTTGDLDLYAENERRIYEFMSRYPQLMNMDTLNRSFKSRAAQEQEYVAGIRFNKSFFGNLTPLFDRLENVNYYGAL